ncbi:hypothetical protein [Gordonia bronchialis]|nr:hypothetical protein [Gordonia bronchialis]
MSAAIGATPSGCLLYPEPTSAVAAAALDHFIDAGDSRREQPW